MGESPGKSYSTRMKKCIIPTAQRLQGNTKSLHLNPKELQKSSENSRDISGKLLENCLKTKIKQGIIPEKKMKIKLRQKFQNLETPITKEASLKTQDPVWFVHKIKVYLIHT